MQLKCVLFNLRAEIIQRLSHSEGPGLLHVFVFVFHGSIQNPQKKAAAKNLSVRMPLCTVCCDLSTHSEHSIRSHFYLPHSNVHVLFIFLCLCVKDIWPGQSDCFLFKSNVNGHFRECTCILNVSSDKNTSTLDDP